MTKKRIIITAALLTIVVVAAAAGAWMYGNRFGAGDYVQAVLDVSYKNETELYTEITGISAEEASQIFEENLDATMGEFEGSDMPEDLLPLYRELFRTIAREVSYTVGEPQKAEGEGNLYTVPVKVKPVSLFPDTYATFQTRAQEYADQVTDRVMDGGEMPSEQEMQDQIYEIYYEVLKERVDSGMLYSGARDVILHVEKAGSRTFRIREEDMDRLDSVLIEDVGE